MVIYLAAAIDHRSHTEDIFQVLGKKLWPAQCFNPKGAFINANPQPQPWPRDDEFVATMNFTGIQHADVLLAYVEPNILSFGVPMELMYAVAIGKPVILVINGIDPGIYARLFSNAVIKFDDLSLSAVNEILDKLNSFGSAERLEALRRKNWICNLLKEKQNG